MTQVDIDRARAATEAIYTLGFGIIGVSSPTYDQRATTRALVVQETISALVDALNVPGTYKTDTFDYFLAARLEALRAQLETLAAEPTTLPASVEAAPLEEPPPEVAPLGRFQGPPPPLPGQLPNPYLAKYPLASPPDPGTGPVLAPLPAPPLEDPATEGGV